MPQTGPKAAEQVSNPRWLSKVLSKKSPGTRVESASAESMGFDMGNASTAFRLRIKYAENPHDLPREMIVKLPKDSVVNKVPFNVTRMNEMEALFYGSGLIDELRDVHKLNFPRGYAGDYFPYGGDCYTIMEDVVSSSQKARFTRETEPITEMSHAKSIVRTIARLHGPFFDARERFEGKGDLSWLARPSDEVQCMAKFFFDHTFDLFVKRVGDMMPKDIVQDGRKLSAVAQQLLDYMALPPFTVVHGDCHLENSYFTKGELGMYDMQLLRCANGAWDLATFMGGSFSPELMGGGQCNEDGELALLSEYLDALREARGSELVYVDALGRKRIYNLSTLHADYKLALALMLVLNVSAVAALPFDTSASHDYDHYIRRLGLAIHRTSAINFAIWYLSVPNVCKELGLTRGVNPEVKGHEVAPVHRYIPGRATNVEYNVAMHEAELSPEEPRGLFDKYVRRPLIYRFIKRATESRQGYHGQKTTGMDPVFLEGHKSVTFAEGTPMQDHALDSYYLSAFSKSCPSFALRWARRYKEANGEVWLAIRLSGDDDTVWTIADHPNSTVFCTETSDDTVMIRGKDGSTMTFTCNEPMKRWTAKFKGFLKSTSTGETLAASFELETEACMDHFAFGSDGSPHMLATALSHEPVNKAFFDELRASHQEHYEQFCYVRGSFKLGADRKYEIYAKGMRDRAFGMREWGYLQRYIASYFYFGPMENGSCATIIMASLPTMTKTKLGFVSEGDGAKPGTVDAMSGFLGDYGNDGVPAQEWEHAFRCNGKHYLCRGFALPEDSLGLNMQNAMWVHLRFAYYQIYSVDPDTLELKAESGPGASEFGYRFKGYVPFRPSSAVAAPILAKMGH